MLILTKTKFSIVARWRIIQKGSQQISKEKTNNSTESWEKYKKFIEK